MASYLKNSESPLQDGEGLRALQPKIVLFTGAVLGILALVVPSGVHYRPNRIFEGESVALGSALGWTGLFLGLLWLTSALLGLITSRQTPARASVLAVILGSMPLGLLVAINLEAQRYADAFGEVGRVSLGGGVWLFFLATYISIYATSALVASRAVQVASYALPLIGVALLVGTGNVSDLSIMREYALNQSEFQRQLQVHLSYTLGATFLGCVIGIPAGVLARMIPKLEAPIFGVINVLNVIPVLAFIGILNPILTIVRDKIAVLNALGVQAVGWVPVIIVLSLYACYPIARNTHSGIGALDESVVDAARGIGMGVWRRLFEVELPLALPVIIAGIRIALVQSTAGAIIAGLVGGGGLGTFVFMGASQTATDLVLLGTIPIVIGGLLFDRTAWALEQALSRRKSS